MLAVKSGIPVPKKLLKSDNQLSFEATVENVGGIFLTRSVVVP